MLQERKRPVIQTCACGQGASVTADDDSTMDHDDDNDDDGPY